ncbi:MAG: methyltransferase domain-containing protein, partial [Desulfuromonadales bacterium]|nr:methyltransferase domain-containing protein [Desulfuromonadales bacterium]
IGVDHSMPMLEQAKERVAAAGLSGIDLRLGEMTHLPLPDRDVETALLNMVLHHAPHPSAVLAELARVLTPGGTLVIADLRRHEREWARERMADQWLGFEPQELLGWLAQAGFAAGPLVTLAGREGELEILLVTAHLGGKISHHRKGVSDEPCRAAQG